MIAARSSKLAGSLCTQVVCMRRHRGDVPDEGGGAVHGAHAGADARRGAQVRRPGRRGRAGARHAAHHVRVAAAHRAQGARRAAGGRRHVRCDSRTYPLLSLDNNYPELSKVL